MQISLKDAAETFDVDAFVKVVHRHVQAEIVGDLDAVMATVCSEPHYEFHPLGLIVTSLDALRIFYQRVLPLFKEFEPAEGSSTWEEGDAGKYISRRGVVTRDIAKLVRDGKELPIKAVSLFVPDYPSKLVKGEHIYTNAALASVLQARLGADFSSLPGVKLER